MALELEQHHSLFLSGSQVLMVFSSDKAQALLFSPRYLAGAAGGRHDAARAGRRYAAAGAPGLSFSPAPRLIRSGAACIGSSIGERGWTVGPIQPSGLALCHLCRSWTDPTPFIRLTGPDKFDTPALYHINLLLW